jgi:ribosomal protein S18 acetylase RimI-like enzyme
MAPAFIRLTQLDQRDLNHLAALHSAVMHTLLADMGASFVLRYYEIAQKDPSVLCLCAKRASGDIDGWAMGCPTPSALTARLRQPLGWFARQMLRLVFIHPKVLIDLLFSLFSASEANRLNSGQIELTYIGVAPGAQGHGLGKALLDAFIESARQSGYTSIALSVETDNPAAILIYTRAGFHITKTFREGRFKRHRMECAL